MLMRAARVPDALAACQRAIAIEPASVKALTQIGQCHARQGDAEGGVSFFDRALAIKPDDEVALANKIYAQDFSDDSDCARHQAARSEWCRRIGSNISTERPSQYENGRDPSRRIVLGYV